MSTEIEKKEKADWLTKDEKKIILKQFFPPNTQVEEMQYCMKVAESFRLNPILKQIFFVPRKSNVNGAWIEKVEPLAGRDSFLTLAHRTGKFAGIESEVEIKQKPCLVNGEWQTKGELVGIAKVYRTDTEFPFVVEVSYSEYVQTKRDGTPTQFWATKPETMIKKVAESQALRKAFNISGLYSEDELDRETTPRPQTQQQQSKLDLNAIANGEEVEVATDEVTDIQPITEEEQ